MRQALAIVLLLLSVLAMGLWGQYELDPKRFGADFADVLYEVLMLFVLEGEWTNEVEVLPLQLQITRLLAPLASVTGILIVLTRGAWVEIVNSFARYKSDHIVVAGLGEMSWQFVVSMPRPRELTIVERSPENLYVKRARALGVHVLIGDMLDTAMLRKVNLPAARHLVTFTGNDGTNVELAIKARSFMASNPTSRQLRIHLHINDTRISAQLEGYPKFFDDSSAAGIDFFSVYDLNARILLNQYPPERFAEVFGQQQVHIALYEFGRLAEHVLLEALRICHFANQSEIRFTIIDSGRNRGQARLMQESSNLASICKIDYVELDLNAQEFSTLSESLLQSVTEHVVCCSTDERSLEVALLLRTMLLRKRASNAPILVRMQQSSGLAQLLESNQGMPEIPDGLYPFGMLDETLSHENILSDRLDERARAIHDEYLRRNAHKAEAERRIDPAMRVWEELTEPIRKSNRLQADHLGVKLRAVRCASVVGDVATPLTFTEHEAELLAIMEHERWRANKIFDGWRAGPEHIENAKINPFAVRWSEMESSQREEEVDAVRDLPKLLRETMDLGLRREYVIGVTGHRLHRLGSNDAQLRNAVKKELGRLQSLHEDKRLMLMSPLAEGADRIVAKIAMETFGMGLIVPLPLPYELYQSDFEASESVAEFRELVGKAEFYFELPMRFGSLEQLASKNSGDPNPLRDQQYALVGAYIVERCDELIAIYDGKGSGGEGGTGQIIEWREQGSVPEEYHIEASFFTLPEQKPAIVIDPLNL